MTASTMTVTGKELFFDKNDIIVSKTDLKGRITYANDTFFELAEYSEKEIIGAPHSIIRHPHMPRAIFKMLWDSLANGKEIFAYVVNRSKSGGHYWVTAHVTPSRDSSGKIVGYHSNRRVPDRDVLEGTIIPLYDQILAEEKKHGNKKQGLQSSFELVLDILKKNEVSYDEFFFSLLK